MPEIRSDQQWKRAVKKRDGNTCRQCGVTINLHAHHIKPRNKYPALALVLDNGITLCGNCHARLTGREESVNLKVIISDGQIGDQLMRFNDIFCDYLDCQLRSEDPDTRLDAVFQLFNQLQLYPDSLNQFLPIIRCFLNTENEYDAELAKQMVSEFLRRSSSEPASQVVIEYETQYEVTEWHRLAESGNARAQYNLAMMYANGYGVERDYAEAVKWYRKSAEQGVATAQNNLAGMYANGYGVERDYAEAVKWYRKSAEQGVATAQNNLAGMYANGYGVERDYAEAVKWYRKSAEQGDTTAQNNLAGMYANGYGVERDYAEAVKWYRKSAEQGDTTAQNNLAGMYANGDGVERDYAEAVKWYRKSAEQGDDVALEWLYANSDASTQCDFGSMYANRREYAEAVKWYRKSAERGDATAQCNLGLMYHEGRGGVDRDKDEAKKWYRKSAEQGDSRAQSALKHFKELNGCG